MGGRERKERRYLRRLWDATGHLVCWPWPVRTSCKLRTTNVFVLWKMTQDEARWPGTLQCNDSDGPARSHVARAWPERHHANVLSFGNFRLCFKLYQAPYSTMGGNAFRTLLPDASFPRMDSALYEERKEYLTARLRTLYALVAVPHEAPGKMDYGDIDFVVCQPSDSLDQEKLQTTLGAQQVIALGDVSNLAVPLRGENSYCQVDLHVCVDTDDWDRTIFFLSYGDVGMTLGLMARSVNLTLGRHGLKVCVQWRSDYDFKPHCIRQLAKPLPTSPQLSFVLSSSLPRILNFFGLSFDRWRQGFASEEDIFSWLSSSRFFNPAKLLRSEAANASGRKAREARPMYQRFLDRVRQRKAPQNPPTSASVSLEAIDFFGRRNLYDAVMHIAAVKGHVSSIFSGTLIRDWTGINGVPVRFIMDEMKRRLGGEDELRIVTGVSLDSLEPNDIPPMHLTLKIWESGMAGMQVDEVKAMATKVKEDLDAEGKLQHDWRAANQKKALQK